MPRNALREHLSELHEELASAGEIDPALRAQLRDVADDIESLLARDDQASLAAAGEPLLDRVKRSTVDFEAEHPRLARILNDVGDTLTKLGI